MLGYCREKFRRKDIKNVFSLRRCATLVRNLTRIASIIAYLINIIKVLVYATLDEEYTNHFLIFSALIVKEKQTNSDENCDIFTDLSNYFLMTV